jgi:hypothetical protein
MILRMGAAARHLRPSRVAQCDETMNDEHHQNDWFMRQLWGFKVRMGHAKSEKEKLALVEELDRLLDRRARLKSARTNEKA